MKRRVFMNEMWVSISTGFFCHWRFLCMIFKNYIFITWYAKIKLKSSIFFLSLSIYLIFLWLLATLKCFWQFLVYRSYMHFMYVPTFDFNVFLIVNMLLYCTSYFVYEYLKFMLSLLWFVQWCWICINYVLKIISCHQKQSLLYYYMISCHLFHLFIISCYIRIPVFKQSYLPPVVFYNRCMVYLLTVLRREGGVWTLFFTFDIWLP